MQHDSGGRNRRAQQPPEPPGDEHLQFQRSNTTSKQFTFSTAESKVWADAQCFNCQEFGHMRYNRKTREFCKKPRKLQPIGQQVLSGKAQKYGTRRDVLHWQTQSTWASRATRTRPATQTTRTQLQPQPQPQLQPAQQQTQQAPQQTQQQQHQIEQQKQQIQHQTQQIQLQMQQIQQQADAIKQLQHAISAQEQVISAFNSKLDSMSTSMTNQFMQLAKASAQQASAQTSTESKEFSKNTQLHRRGSDPSIVHVARKAPISDSAWREQTNRSVWSLAYAAQNNNTVFNTALTTTKKQLQRIDLLVYELCSYSDVDYSQPVPPKAGTRLITGIVQSQQRSASQPRDQQQTSQSQNTQPRSQSEPRDAQTTRTAPAKSSNSIRIQSQVQAAQRTVLQTLTAPTSTQQPQTQKHAAQTSQQTTHNDLKEKEVKHFEMKDKDREKQELEKYLAQTGAHSKENKRNDHTKQLGSVTTASGHRRSTRHSRTLQRRASDSATDDVDDSDFSDY
jgi:hypothetical protein